jgi:hypothetical protein
MVVISGADMSPKYTGILVTPVGSGHKKSAGDHPGAQRTWTGAQPNPRGGAVSTATSHPQSVSALAKQFDGLNAAAAALGFSSVAALQNAIMTYCGG